MRADASSILQSAPRCSWNQSTSLSAFEAFTTATNEVMALADANRELITSGYRSARETLLTLGDEPHSYGADGSAVAVTDSRRRLVDWSL